MTIVVVENPLFWQPIWKHYFIIIKTYPSSWHGRQAAGLGLDIRYRIRVLSNPSPVPSSMCHLQVANLPSVKFQMILPLTIWLFFSIFPEKKKIKRHNQPHTPSITHIQIQKTRASNGDHQITHIQTQKRGGTVKKKVPFGPIWYYW